MATRVNTKYINKWVLDDTGEDGHVIYRRDPAPGVRCYAVTPQGVFLAADPGRYFLGCVTLGGK